jgi:Ca2+-binding RTX toxin-like protein
MSINQTIPSQAMNLGGFPATYNDSFTLLNLFHGAQGWQSSDDHSLISSEFIDSKGWIKKLPPLPEGGYVLANVFYTQEMPAGKFILEWKGEGEIVPWQDYKVLGPNKIEIDYQANYANGDDGITLRLLSTDPNNTGNYIRDIKLYDAKYADLVAMGETFNPEWLDRIDDFQLLRTHGMQETNFTTIKDYDLLVESKDQAFWGNSGRAVPLEALVEISNTTKADLWITIPHLATDDYMRKVAEYAKANLNPNLKVYVEYSNEYWTEGFIQHQYFIDKGKELFGDAPFANGQAYGARVAEMTKIFKDVFGNEQDRLVPTLTLNHNAFNTAEAETVLNTPDWVTAGGKSPLDAGIEFVATDGYFGWFNSEKFFDDIVDGFIAQGDAKYDAAGDYLIKEIKTDLAPAWAKGRALLDSLGIKFGVYEGGALLINGGFTAPDEQVDPKYTEFNKAFQLTTQMKQAYEVAIAEWNKVGTAPFAWFADVGRASDFGDYGLWNGVNYVPEPRTEAITDANSKPAPWDAQNPRKASAFDNGKYDMGIVSSETIEGTALSDRLYGLGGSDTLSGKAGADRLVGGSGKDTLTGGEGSDVLVGGADADVIDGGGGFDFASFQTSTSAVAADLGTGKGTQGDALGDSYRGIENLKGGTGADTLRGNAADNWLAGGEGDDALVGRGGRDRMQGGTGDDKLTGGRGSDIFYLGPGRDTVTDWKEGDYIAVSSAGWGFGDPGRVKVQQVGNDTVLTRDSWTLVLQNTRAPSITTGDDFLFS